MLLILTCGKEAAEAFDSSLKSGFHDCREAEDIASIDVDLTLEPFQQKSHYI